MIEAIVFGALFGLLLLSHEARQRLKAKSRFEWLLDISNLTIQGTLIPLLRYALFFILLKALWPQGQGLLQLHWATGFLINFVVVDYLYYWNHRLMHSRRAFPVHLVHHTVSHMDVFATSRNTLWTSFFFVYLWVNGLMLYLTDLNAGFVFAMALTASLDLWKHSNSLSSRPKLQQMISRFGIMTPMDHAWHHSSRLNYNYGATWNLFDRIHGTYLSSENYPERLGVNPRLSPMQLLLNPFANPTRPSSSAHDA